ncbi:MAG TPA: serine hydrolase domain-containing protein, partial [Opitutaceae bacterium]
MKSVNIASPQLRLALLGVSFALTVFPALARAGEPEYIDPRDAGFSPERLKYIDQFYAEKVRHGDLAGEVTLISRHGKIVYFSPVGYADIDKKVEMKKDTIFRLYSMSKAITTTALMTLYQDGKFQIKEPLSKYIPEFANLKMLRTPDSPLTDVVPVPKYHQPTIQDALRHTVGFTHGLGTDPYDNLYTEAKVLDEETSLAELTQKLSTIPLRYEPGTKYVYSLGPDIAARLVEVLSGAPYDDYLEKKIFAPLGMHDTGFWLSADKASRLAPVYWWKDGKLVLLDEAHGHPEGGVLVQPASVNSYLVNHKRKGGSYGLVATTEDYWRFAQMMLNHGELNGVRILQPEIVNYMIQDHLAAVDPDHV